MRAILLVFALMLATGVDQPALPSGDKPLVLHLRDGGAVRIGTVAFVPQGQRTAFKVTIDPARTKLLFLSMRDFRCVEGPEVTCHVPYPYANPGTIAAGDYGWLEHALLFLTKSPGEFSAKLENGLYFPLALTDRGFAGRPQRIDLNLIASPPDDPAKQPYADVDRRDEPEGQRWVSSLTIGD